MRVHSVKFSRSHPAFQMIVMNDAQFAEYLYKSYYTQYLPE